MSEHPIHVDTLVKTFGTVRALDGLDLHVRAASVHGFLGPNGSGKSTTIRTLLGLYRPDSGTVRVLGEDPSREASTINRQLAYIPGEVALWPNFTGAQVLDALGGLRGRRDREREKELIERFDLDPSKKVRTYSKGNRQKVALIAALAAPVDLFLLDEPTSGLDPLMEQVFTQVIGELSGRGATVLLSSHILAEVQALCSHVTIIKDGRVVEDGSLDHLRSLSETRIRLGFNGGGPELLRTVGAELEGLRITVEQHGAHLMVQVPSALVPKILGIAAAHRLTEVQCEPASLEDLFLRHYEGGASSIHEGGASAMREGEDR